METLASAAGTLLAHEHSAEQQLLSWLLMDGINRFFRILFGLVMKAN